MIVLALNRGSSSLKAGIFEVSGPRDEKAAAPARPLARTSIDCEATTDLADALRALVRKLVDRHPSAERPDAVGHRVVHGGSAFVEPVLLGEDETAAIAELGDLAPLHNDPSLECIRAARALFGAGVPMVAAFDTAFHATMPEHAWRYAIPRDLADRHGVRRFGFHGLSYESIVTSFGDVAGIAADRARIVALHLGSGCSAAAIANGRSVETSMGFTPLEGLVMGTRSGDLDPALVGWIARKERVAVETVEDWLNHRSGLLGLSGLSSDVRVLLEREADHSGARLALESFCHRARKYVGAYVAALGGADAVVFTGAIGERSPAIRARVCAGLEALGIRIDDARNASIVGRAGQIGADGSSVASYVIPSDEERTLAVATARVVSAAR